MTTEGNGQIQDHTGTTHDGAATEMMRGQKVLSDIFDCENCKISLQSLHVSCTRAEYNDATSQTLSD